MNYIYLYLNLRTTYARHFGPIHKDTSIYGPCGNEGKEGADREFADPLHLVDLVPVVLEALLVLSLGIVLVVRWLLHWIVELPMNPHTGLSVEHESAEGEEAAHRGEGPGEQGLRAGLVERPVPQQVRPHVSQGHCQDDVEAITKQEIISSACHLPLKSHCHWLNIIYIP
jgi:hypothetical protein